MKSHYFPSIFWDIRFWILLFFVLRLYGITHPPLDMAHSWRQVTVNMVARNYSETDENFLFPRVDMAGEKSGITGMEFPLLNYFIFIFIKLFGFQHWYGRLINLVVSSVGMWYYFKLIRDWFASKTAFYATMLLLTSLWFSYARKIMPDTFSTAWVIMGLYFYSVYLKKGGIKSILLAWLLTTLGVLSKIPSAFLLSILLLMIAQFPPAINSRKIWIISGLGLTVLLLVGWYGYWVPYLVETYHYWHFYMGTGWVNGYREISTHLLPTAEKFYSDALKFSGFALFIGGIYCSYKWKRSVFNLFLLASFVFLWVILKAGQTFYLHTYYVIPFIPVMALVASQAIMYFEQKRYLAVSLLSLCMLEGILNQYHDFRIRDDRKYLLKSEAICQQFIGKQQLILSNGGTNPTELYFSNRKGWTLETEQIQTHTLDSLHQLGCAYLLWDKNKGGGHWERKTPPLFEDQDFSLYRLP